LKRLLVILVLWTGIVYAQYPYQYDFTVDQEGWTITDPGTDSGQEAPTNLCFNRTGNYIDGGMHRMTSPVFVGMTVVGIPHWLEVVLGL
jgi:hypothetical protein